MKRIITVICAGLSVGACVTDDPAKGGFLGGVGGLSSGAYDRRVQERQQTLDNEKDRNLSLQRTRDDLRRQEAALAAERAELTTKMNNLDQDLKRLGDRLGSAQQSRRLAPETSAKIQTELDQIKRSSDLIKRDEFAATEEKRKRLDELTKRKAELEQTLSQALLR